MQRICGVDGFMLDMSLANTIYYYLSILPLHSYPNSHLYQQTHDFTRENDFQQLLPDLDDIDLNDPDNDHLLYLKDKHSAAGDSASFRLYGAEFGATFKGEDGYMFSNYVRYKETPRMKLLQLRCVKPYLFNSPIPLNENVIKNSELYKTIFQQELHEKMARIGGNADGQGYSANDDALTDNKVSANKAKVSVVRACV